MKIPDTIELGGDTWYFDYDVSNAVMYKDRPDGNDEEPAEVAFSYKQLYDLVYLRERLEASLSTWNIDPTNDEGAFQRRCHQRIRDILSEWEKKE